MVGMHEYSMLRMMFPDWANCNELPWIESDTAIITQGLLDCGIPEENMTTLVNPLAEKLDEVFEAYEELVESNLEKGLQTLLFVYFGGHTNGEMMLLNEESEEYGLEKRVLELAKMQGSIVVSIYDCYPVEMVVE